MLLGSYHRTYNDKKEFKVASVYTNAFQRQQRQLQELTDARRGETVQRI